MDTAALDQDSVLTWADICVRYPDQYVCLVDIEDEPGGGPAIKSARVVGYGPTGDDAFEPIRGVSKSYGVIAVTFTGISKQTFIRPSMIIDDEDLRIIRS